MKKYIVTLAVVSSVLVSCEKWTEVESKAIEFDEIAHKDLKEKRDNFRWEAEDKLTEESKKSLEEYWAQLREYKRRSWLNGGEAVGQKPMFYYWWAGERWKTTPGIASSWLQSVPDSVTCISLWGGYGKRPSQITEIEKKDLEIFHKKGSAVLLCWQTPSSGLGLPNSIDGKVSGFHDFRKKYPFAENYKKWGQIYARELSRYIIACGFDGYDVDWETCGDHGSVTKEGTDLMIFDNNYENISNFVREMAKYFGPVGPEFFVKTQEEREANIKSLFDTNTEGFHPNEKEFINEFKPYLPADYITKRYYFCADVPCGHDPVVFDDDKEFKLYFDKHFMQDYTIPGVGSHIKQLGGNLYNSTSLDIQTKRSTNAFQNFYIKGEVINQKKIWGFGLYHGELDYESTHKTKEVKNYLDKIGQTRNYSYHAITREIIRIADPRPSYANYKESEALIIIP